MRDQTHTAIGRLRVEDAGKHVLILSPGFPAEEADDSCIPALQEYLRAFVTAYPTMRLTVIALHYPPTPFSYQWNGITVLPLGGNNRFFRKPSLWYRAIAQAQAVHRDHPASVIHSFWLGECALIGAYAAKRIGTPHICTLMGQELRGLNRYASLLRRGPTRYIALSDLQGQDFERRMGRRPDGIIPWGIEPTAALETHEGRDIDLLGVGSLSAVKNFRLFVAAAAAAVRTRPGLRCVIAGDGPERAAIEALLRENRLEKNVTLTGMIPRHEVLALMRKSTILLHPSHYEGFGYVFAEALASGMEIVSFEVGTARPHPRWHIARDEQEFVSCAVRALDAATGHAPLALFPVSETVSRYASLYGLASAGVTA